MVSLFWSDSNLLLRLLIVGNFNHFTICNDLFSMLFLSAFVSLIVFDASEVKSLDLTDRLGSESLAMDYNRFIPSSFTDRETIDEKLQRLTIRCSNMPWVRNQNLFMECIFPIRKTEEIWLQYRPVFTIIILVLAVSESIETQNVSLLRASGRVNSTTVCSLSTSGRGWEVRQLSWSFRGSSCASARLLQGCDFSVEKGACLLCGGHWN